MPTLLVSLCDRLYLSLPAHLPLYDAENPRHIPYIVVSFHCQCVRPAV
jgi:hypothetical protein